MNKKKLTIIIVALVIGIITLAIGTSYALFTFNVTRLLSTLTATTFSCNCFATKMA